jgi:hypothetical protein
MTKLDANTRFEICGWMQNFRNSLAAELGETAAAYEIFSMPSFWTQHLLVSEPVTVAKNRRWTHEPRTFIDVPAYNGEDEE